MEVTVTAMTEEYIEESVDLFMNTFSKEPWYDVYESRDQVVTYFRNFYKNNYFVGYVGIVDNKIAALSIGIAKPWINGMEYYIQEFCVDYTQQGKGIGSKFIQSIMEDIKNHDMNAIILNTDKGFPAEAFYRKNGFEKLKDLIILAKQ